MAQSGAGPLPSLTLDSQELRSMTRRQREAQDPEGKPGDVLGDDREFADGCAQILALKPIASMRGHDSRTLLGHESAPFFGLLAEPGIRPCLLLACD